MKIKTAGHKFALASLSRKEVNGCAGPWARGARRRVALAPELAIM